MVKRILPALVLLSVAPLFPRDKVENWLEVRSDPFVVVTNANDKEGRRVAHQFERMRSIFHAQFPRMQVDPDAPVVVLAVKDEKDFRALEPAAYLAKGSLRLGGLFLRAPEKNYVLMRLDAEGEHPYEVVYHEYTHLLLAKSEEWLPLWLNEGLAEFYENTEIRNKDVVVGEPSGQNLMLLRQQAMMPLATLFAVDHNSPYYHEENKGSIFYAESWALTHYLEIRDAQQKLHRLADYSELLAQKVDPVEAAARSFGDLRRLESDLRAYVQQAHFLAFRIPVATEVDESTFKSEPLASPQADAIRADFLAYNQRTSDARSLIEQILRDDPKNVLAHETMGYLEFREGHLDEARKWYAQAVALDSQSYLANYYFASIAMMGRIDPSEEAQVEASLRTAIKLNPQFAPSFDRLAVFLAMRHRDLEEAHRMGLTAVSLDPANVGYRINVSTILLNLQQGQNAVAVLRVASKLAKTTQDSLAVENALMNAQAYSDAQQRIAEEQARFAAEAKAAGTSTEDSDSGKVPHLTRRDTFVPKGPHRFLTGTLKHVHCDTPEIDLTVDANGKLVAFHAANYYKIQFSTLNFKPSGDLNPCKDLEGRPAKVEYVESATASVAPKVLAVELHK